jgi:hypothetical protein
VEATGVTVSKYMEILNPQTMTGRLYENGEVIAEYQIEQCDSCKKLVKWDKFGYTKGQGREKLIWLCGLCR